MKSNKIFKTFFRFLKERHAYIQFIKNTNDFFIKDNQSVFLFNNKEITNGYDYIMHKLNTHQVRGIVNNSFSWDETIEGYKFWYDICVEWIKAYDKKQLGI